jgi:hypothetical protein
VKWGNPPERISGRNGSDRHRDTAQRLKDRPGEWALAYEAASHSLATNIRLGATAAYRPAGSFEARTVTLPGTHRVDVYVRYIGEGAA